MTTPPTPPKGPTFPHVGSSEPQGSAPVPLESFSAEQRRIYLDEFRRTTLPLRSASVAGVSLATVKVHEQSDPAFAAALGEAKRWHLESIEATIQGRAGVGEEGMESIDGIRYSDDLLKLYAKARMPKRYGDKVAVRAQVEVEGEVQHVVDVGNLSVAGRQHLRALLYEGGTPSNGGVGEPAPGGFQSTTIGSLPPLGKPSSNGHRNGTG